MLEIINKLQELNNSAGEFEAMQLIYKEVLGNRDDLKHLDNFIKEFGEANFNAQISYSILVALSIIKYHSNEFTNYLKLITLRVESGEIPSCYKKHIESYS